MLREHLFCARRLAKWSLCIISIKPYNQPIWYQLLLFPYFRDFLIWPNFPLPSQILGLVEVPAINKCPYALSLFSLNTSFIFLPWDPNVFWEHHFPTAFLMDVHVPLGFAFFRCFWIISSSFPFKGPDSHENRVVRLYHPTLLYCSYLLTPELSRLIH